MMERFAKKPFAFSDGTYIPAGTTVGVCVTGVHNNESNYTCADEFHPWRFISNAAAVGNSPRMSKTTSTYLGFGHGKLACPGRFFAGLQLQLMLAHIVLQYDVKYADGEHRPPNMSFGGIGDGIPNPRAKILMRKRLTC
jgi:cytochrome P450